MSKIKWTTTPPTKPGWYWWRDLDDDFEAQPVEVFNSYGPLYMLTFGESFKDQLRGEWGPEILLPKQLKGGNA